MSLLTTLFNIILEVSANAKRQERKEKEYRLRRKTKLSLFTNDMVVYIDNVNKSTTKKKKNPAGTNT